MTQITAHSLQNLQVQIDTGKFTILADEPESAGGDDTAPNPYIYLLSALAACKIITVQMYAQRKKWPVDKINLAMQHKKIAADACADCETQGAAKVDIIECEISFEGDLDEEQQQRLAEIADRCPVHRSITSETKIYTRLATAV